jgi:beta-N-acetylhexosaminidase
MATPDPALLRLVNSVLLPGFNGTSVPRWLADAMDTGLGGVLYFAHNLPAPENTRAFSDDIHQRRHDIIISVDEEGGDVTRLQVGKGSSAPGNAALGAVDDVDLTRRVALALAGVQRDSGIDLDFAPSVDVNSNPDNPVIGVRSFGADAALVARHGAAFIEGLQDGGIAACAKHFPGHGDTDVDSHFDLPVLDVGLGTLRERDLLPFEAAVRAGVKTIMLGHVRIPEFGALPATFNPELVAVARKELGFDGVLTTDALDMAGASRGIGIGGAAVRALQAGADLLCLGNPVSRDDEADYASSRDAVLEALRNGTLTVERLEGAAERISQLSAWCVEQREETTESPDLDDVGFDAAERAIRTIGDVQISGPAYVADLRAAPNMAAGTNPRHVQRMLAEKLPDTLVGEGSCGNGGPTAAESIIEAADQRVLVVIVRGPHRDPGEAATLQVLRAARPDMVVIHVGWPYQPESLGERVVVAYGSGAAISRAVVGRLIGT